MGCLTEDDLQGILLPLLSSYMKQHPRNVAGQLLRAFWSAPSQTGQWLAKRLQELEPKVPEKWRPGVLREVATICIRDDVADYEGKQSLTCMTSLLLTKVAIMPEGGPTTMSPLASRPIPSGNIRG